MRLQTTFNLFLSALFAFKVQGAQGGDACPRKEPPSGVLTLTLGSEVILGCRGDVTVDGVLLAVVTKHNGRVRRRRAITPQREREISDFTEKYHSEIRNVTIHGTYQKVTTNGLYGKDKGETKTTAKPLITTEKQMSTGHIMHAISLPIQPNRVRGINEGGAYKVTMEMGGEEYVENMTVEYKQYEDNGDEEEGLRVTRAISRRAHWTRNGQAMRWGVAKGGVLRLPALQLKDSGNYTCFRGGKLISSVKISVGVPPEIPTLKCYKKFHTSKIRCEWISKQPIIPRPHCYLLLRKGWAESSHTACSYSVERSRCWCALPGEEGDRNIYIAKLCVANTVGSAISEPLRYSPQNIIKPDPPARVVVREVMGHFQTLHISWSYPASWRQGFYFLQFQLRYRPLHAREYQQVDIDGTKLSWVILDAMPHTQYEMQLRTKDEYDGLWSDWSAPVYAHPWTAPEPTLPSNVYTSVEPFWTFPEGSGELGPDSEEPDDGADWGAVMWVHVLWVFGLCVLIILTILSVYSLRYRVHLMYKQDKQVCSPSCSLSSPPPPLLQQLVMAAHQQSQHNFLPEEEEAGIHLHNVDYFLSHGD